MEPCRSLRTSSLRLDDSGHGGGGLCTGAACFKGSLGGLGGGVVRPVKQEHTKTSNIKVSHNRYPAEYIVFIEYIVFSSIEARKASSLQQSLTPRGRQACHSMTASWSQALLYYGYMV